MSACEQMDARFDKYNTTFHATRAFVRYPSQGLLTQMVDPQSTSLKQVMLMYPLGAHHQTLYVRRHPSRRTRRHPATERCLSKRKPQLAKFKFNLVHKPVCQQEKLMLHWVGASPQDCGLHAVLQETPPSQLQRDTGSPPQVKLGSKWSRESKQLAVPSNTIVSPHSFCQTLAVSSVDDGAGRAELRDATETILVGK